MSTAGRCLEFVRSGEIQLFVSPSTLAEIREVLSRPRILALLPHASREAIEKFLEDIVTRATLVRNVPEKFRFERDPKDAPYLNLAISVELDYLVTRDKDLLDLMTSYGAESKEFRQRFRRVKIIQPEELILALDQRGP